MKTFPSSLLELFSYPICRLSQLVCQADCGNDSSSKQRGWGGPAPVFAIEFEDVRKSQLLVASTDTALRLDINCDINHDVMVTKAIQLVEDTIGEEIAIGFFDLDSVICPVPEWDKLRITKAAVIEAINGDIIGFCIWINLGIRIGMFVPPFPGATLSFNDSCDVILSQAAAAETIGLVRVLRAEYPGNDTPSQMTTIDWFDWLRE